MTPLYVYQTSLRNGVGMFNSKHFVLALKVKSVLDPCEDDNVSLGADSMQEDGDSDADSEGEVPIIFFKSGKMGWSETGQIKHLIEDIMEKLVDEGTLVRDGKDIFSIMRPRLMDKMTKEGKRVIHSDLTKKKLAEVQRALDAMMDQGETLNGSNNSENQIGTNRRDTSTFSVVHSIGSDLTRTKDRSNLHHKVSNSSDPTVSKLRGNGHNTPTSKNQPIASIESYAAGSEKGRNGNVNQDDIMDSVVCSGQSSLSKRSRKSSTVKEPILQYMKRQKSNEV
ncbi:hypothetical protein Tco_0764812 [Tanacetum coccineum]